VIELPVSQLTNLRFWYQKTLAEARPNVRSCTLLNFEWQISCKSKKIFEVQKIEERNVKYDGACVVVGRMMVVANN
jgi:hypothetical protein